MKLLHCILLKVISILSKKPQIETSAQNMSLNNLLSFYNMNDGFMPSGILRKKKEQENLISTLFTKTWSLIPWDSFQNILLTANTLISWTILYFPFPV